MKRNSEWRKFARSHTIGDYTFWFHPTIPAQASYVSDFLYSQDGIDIEAMSMRVYSFFLVQGYLIDFEDNSDSMLSVYFEDIEGLALQEAFTIHMSHPLLSSDLYAIISDAYDATRDKSLQELSKPLDVDSDENEDAVEKKD